MPTEAGIRAPVALHHIVRRSIKHRWILVEHVIGCSENEYRLYEGFDFTKIVKKCVHNYESGEFNQVIGFYRSQSLKACELYFITFCYHSHNNYYFDL